MRLNLQGVDTVLCLGAHADDIEIGCGGTLMQLRKTLPEAAIHWVIVSGTAERHAEAEAGFERISGRGGRGQLRCCDFRDSYFPDQWAGLKDQFHRLASEFAPQLIFTHCRADAHQDHRTVCELTYNAFRGPAILEYEIPKFDGDLGLPNLFVPLEETVVSRKIELLSEVYVSQRHRPWFDDDTFKALMRLRGLECNSPSRYAEAFHSRKLAVEFGV